MELFSAFFPTFGGKKSTIKKALLK